MNLFGLEERVAVVTGASSGLGVIMAEGLAEAGAKVVLVARRAERLARVVEDFRGKGFDVHAVKCDVTVEEEVEQLMDEVVKKYERLDILINNAGTTTESPTWEMSLEKWEKVIKVNMTGTFLCCKHAIPYMKEKRYGKIVNISSVYGIIADVSPELPYYSSKAGVIGLTRQLALELAPYNINVNAIAPGFFPSEMTRPFIEDPDTLSATLAKIPMKRIGKPEELKGVVVFLSSKASDYVTGQLLVVDGGWSIW